MITMALAAIVIIIAGIMVLFSACILLQVNAQLSGHKTIVENPTCLNLFGLTSKCPPSKTGVDLGLNISRFQMAHNGG